MSSLIAGVQGQVELVLIHYSYYLIEPRAELVTWLTERANPELVRQLLEPVVLRNPEAGKSAWRRQDHAQAMKILHLVSWRDYTSREYTSQENNTMFDAIFGTPQISVGLFDRWWTLRLLPHPEDTEDLLPILFKHACCVEQTGNKLVDSWLESAKDADSPDSSSR